jgi:hypothetical protein
MLRKLVLAVAAAACVGTMTASAFQLNASAFELDPGEVLYNLRVINSNNVVQSYLFYVLSVLK